MTGDIMKNSNFLKHTIDDTFELTELFKESPKRDAKLNKIKNYQEDEESDKNLFGCKQAIKPFNIAVWSN